MKTSKNMRQRILEKAAEKFFKYGFYKVSIDSIVADLHTSKSSIYKFFKTKEDLVKAVLDNINDEINLNLDRIIKDKNKSFDEKFEEITVFTGKILSRVGEDFLVDIKIHTPEIWNEYEKMREQRLKNYYGKLIDQGIKDKILRKDINKDFLLLVYTKLTEIAVKPIQLEDISISNIEAYMNISKIFLEGAKLKNN